MTTGIPRFSFVLLILSLLQLPSLASAAQFESIEEAIAYAEMELAREEKPEQVAIVYKYAYADDTKESARVRFYCGGGFQPERAEPGAICVRLVRVCTQGLNIRFDQRGFHQSTRTVAAAVGDVIVVDDIVLKRVTDQEAAEVIGRIWLEGDTDPDGIKVTMEDYETKTDDRGEFRFHNIPTGEKYLSASVPGYGRMGARIKIQPKSRKVVALKGYLKRTARVRWAYQPDGTRNLMDGLESGEAVLGDKLRSQFVWADALSPARQKGDFSVRQIEDRLVLTFQYVSRQGPGWIRLADIDFDEVLQAPGVVYSRNQVEINKGNIFVLKTLDGEHYGKLEVIDITLGDEGRERFMSDLARQVPD